MIAIVGIADIDLERAPAGTPATVPTEMLHQLRSPHEQRDRRRSLICGPAGVVDLEATGEPRIDSPVLLETQRLVDRTSIVIVDGDTDTDRGQARPNGSTLLEHRAEGIPIAGGADGKCSRSRTTDRVGAHRVDRGLAPEQHGHPVVPQPRVALAGVESLGDPTDSTNPLFWCDDETDPQSRASRLANWRPSLFWCDDETDPQSPQVTGLLDAIDAGACLSGTKKGDDARRSSR